MRRLIPFVAVLAIFVGTSRAELVTVVYEGTIDQIDPALVSGPFSLGQTVSGSYTYESDPALNPDTNPGVVGQYLIASSSDVSIGAQSYATSSGLGLFVFNDVDGWDADLSVLAPPIGAYSPIGFFVSLRDLDSTVFADDSLPPAPPALGEFEMAKLGLFYFDGSTLAEVSAGVAIHEVAAEPVTLQFAGVLIDEFDAGGATYSAVDVGGPMDGTFTIGATSAGSTLEPPAKYLFPGPEFFGTLNGDGIGTSTEGSTRPLEVAFSDDVVSDQETIDLINDILGTNLPAGTPFDLAEIETDITIDDRRIEFGVSFIALDVNTIVGNGYRPFPMLDEVDIALFFVVEELNDVEIYNALGLISSFGPVFSPGEALDLRVTAYNETNGLVDIAYTAGCAATDHTIRFGPLAEVGAYGYAGQVCAIGSGGFATFDPGSGDAFFLVVANDGILEGSYGRDSAGAERPADVDDPVCGLVQEIGNSCDP